MNIFATVVISLLACFVPLISCVLSCAFLQIYLSDEDKGYDPGDPDFKGCLRIPKRLFYQLKTATCGKITFLTAFTLVLMSIWLMPIDISNARFGGGMEYALGIIWQIFYGVVLIYCIIVLPCCIFYYEAEDPDKKNPILKCCMQLRWGCCFTCCISIILAIVIGVSYIWLGFVEVPYDAHVSSDFSSSYVAGEMLSGSQTGYKTSGEDYKLRLSIVLYTLALIGLCGYVILICCGGCGLWAYPCSCLKAARDAPRIISRKEFEQKKLKIMTTAKAMLEIGQKLQDLQERGRLNRKHFKLFHDFKQSTYKLQNDWDALFKNYQPTGKVPVLGGALGRVSVYQNSIFCPCFRVCWACCASCCTILWMVHIVIYMALEPLPHVGFSWGGLNIVLYYIDYATGLFPVFGSLFYGILVFHLLVSVISGVTFIAAKIPICSIHPMKAHDTMVNSLLFNVGIFMLASITVNQFCVSAFKQYANNTVLDSIFGASMRNLIFFQYLFMVMVYLFLIFVILGCCTSCCLACCGSRPKKTKFWEKTVKKIGKK